MGDRGWGMGKESQKKVGEVNPRRPPLRQKESSFEITAIVEYAQAALKD